MRRAMAPVRASFTKRSKLLLLLLLLSTHAPTGAGAKARAFAPGSECRCTCVREPCPPCVCPTDASSAGVASTKRTRGRRRRSRIRSARGAFSASSSATAAIQSSRMEDESSHVALAERFRRIAFEAGTSSEHSCRSGDDNLALKFAGLLEPSINERSALTSSTGSGADATSSGGWTTTVAVVAGATAVLLAGLGLANLVLSPGASDGAAALATAAAASASSSSYDLSQWADPRTWLRCVAGDAAVGRASVFLMSIRNHLAGGLSTSSTAAAAKSIDRWTAWSHRLRTRTIPATLALIRKFAVMELWRRFWIFAFAKTRFAWKGVAGRVRFSWKRYCPAWIRRGVKSMVVKTVQGTVDEALGGAFHYVSMEYSVEWISPPTTSIDEVVDAAAAVEGFDMTAAVEAASEVDVVEAAVEAAAECGVVEAAVEAAVEAVTESSSVLEAALEATAA